MDIKNTVFEELNKIKLTYDLKPYTNLFTLSSDGKNGDVCLPCFPLAKELKTNPMVIANSLSEDINNNITASGIIEKAEAVNGYLNIFLNKTYLADNIVKEVISENSNFGKTDTYKGKTVVLDYSSVNLAKYMHIGHLKTTIIGLVMKNIYEQLGYKTVSINYVGDYGTPFGKMITAYKRWGDKDLINKTGVDAIQDLYVRFNREAENDESLNDEARMWFKRIEDGDKEATQLCDWITELCRGEVERLCGELGAKFDSWRGERYYSDKMEPVVEELKSKGLTKVSEGALVVDLEEYGLGIALIKKSDGSSLYLTRDLAAVEDRYNTYHFDKAVYVTDVAQKLHFKQLFKIVELLGKPYAGKLEHIAYGRYSLPTGKISSRLGKQALLRDLLEAGIEKSKEIMAERGTKVTDPDKVSKQVAVGAISFEATKYEKVKDTVYDMEASLNFDGETSPYMQYTYARCCSIIEKSNVQLDVSKINFADIDESKGYGLIKLLNKFPSTVVDAYEKVEPCLIVRLLMDIASEFNKFYTNNRIIDNGEVNLNNLAIVYATKIVFEDGFKLVNIPAITKM
ncbi:MAG TPA: arginine--tRNA ligase [Clostridiales bacterium]|nr:arginine--tRNA ligase [Clostridiales bacterium]